MKKQLQIKAFVRLFMRVSFLQIILLGSLISLGYAKDLSAQILEKKVTLDCKDMPLRKALLKIEKATGASFVYQSQLIPPKEKITLQTFNESLALVLRKILGPLVITYEVDGNQIILSKQNGNDEVELEESVLVPSGSNEVFAVTITGKVTDELNTPLPGVNVLVKGTTMGTTTNSDGLYTLTVPDENSILVFSFIGYTTQELALGNQNEVNVTLQPDIKSLQEVVVVGYGTQKKVNLTGSVSSVSSTELENRPITQASQALAGLASGVTVSQGSGRPGNDGSSITIRGIGTFSAAGTGPLVLIDGLASSMNDVDPNNIKSISILKDAASASIYGTRAANGVILIETKRGQNGKLQVSYNSYVGWQKVTELPQFLESSEYAELKNEANVNMGQGKSYTDEEIVKFKSGSDPDNYPNVPHLKNLLTSGSGFQTNHNLSFMGGDEKNSYLFSLGYLHQDGIVTENKYDKYNLLLNFDSKIKDNLNLKVNLSGNSAATDEPRHYDGEMMHMIAFAVREPSIFAGKKSDGTYGYQDNYSPEAWLDSESFVNRKNKYFLGGTELSWEILKGLTLSGKAGYKYYNWTDNSFASSFIFNPNKTVGPNNLNVSSGDNSLLTLQSLLQYTKTLGNHNFAVLAGFSQEAYQENWTTGYRKDFPNNSLYELNAGSATGMSATGSGAESALRSYFGRLNYDFAGKYLFEANTRYDGTSRFPKKGRWGLFPSFSAGWRISEESFIKNNIAWIDNLKLRASWGKLGNQNIGNYPYQNVLRLGQNYSFGGNLASGAKLTTLANEDITWESTQVTDVGLELSVFEGKLSMVFDYFSKTTSDILYKISVSQVLGLDPSEVNAGEVKNTGFEVLLNYQASIGGFNIGVVPNFSYIKNEVTKIASVQKDIGKGLFVGQPLNAIYGYEADGLFVDADDVASYSTQPYSAQPGLVRYKDISGPDGIPDGQVDATYDRKVIGTTFPKYSFGATITADYNGFDFSLLLHGLGGFEKQMGSYQAFAFYNGGQIQQWQADNRWTEANPDRNAEYPKVTSLNMSAGTIQTSTYWNRNASFLRVKNLQIGYTLPGSMTSKLKISKLRVFVSGQNLFSLNHFYKGWDPEMYQNTGDNTPFYPITSVYTFGVNVKF